MCMLDIIREKSGEIREIAKRHKAEKIWVFGSCARKEERPDSDVDLLVKFAQGTSLFDVGGLNSEISALLYRTVDVVDSSSMKCEPFFAYTVRKDMIAL